MRGIDGNQVLRRIFAVYVVLVIVRVAFSAVTWLLGNKAYAMLIPRSDFFADSIKSGLAQTSISHRLLTEPAVRDWPALFQTYLFANDYLKPGVSIFHSPPLSLLMLMGVATLLLAMSPVAVIAVFGATYTAATAAVAHAASKATGERIATIFFLFMLFAYPSVFMFDRGNMHSGLTSLCVIFYMISACTGRWRRLSWLALAVAVNLRPNVALLALLELVRTSDRRAAITGMIVAGALSIGLALVAYVVVHAIEPRYTPSAFFAGLDLYRRNYIDGGEGLFWNASLANIGKAVNYARETVLLHNPAWTLAASAVGAVMIGALAVLAWLSRVPGPCLAFALAACSVLFTPVLAEYHLLIFAGPLLLLLLTNPEAIAPGLLIRSLGYLVPLQLLCFFQWNGPSLLLFILIALLALAIPFLILRAVGNDGSKEAVPAIVSLAALSPIGSEVTNGFAVSLMVFSTLSWIIWRGFSDRREPAAITPR